MKKYIYRLFAVAGLAAMIAACSNEEINETLPQEEGGEVTTIYVEQPEIQTRLDYGEYDSESGISIRWEEGDKFDLYENANNKVGTFICQRIEENVAKFESQNFTGTGGYYVAIYNNPDKPAVTFSDIVFDMNGQKQYQDMNGGKGHLSNYNAMIAGNINVDGESINGATINFEHYTSILRVEVTLSGASSTIVPSKFTLNTAGLGFMTKFEPFSQSSTHSPNIVLDLQNIEGDSFTAYIAVIGKTPQVSQASKVTDFLEFTVETDDGTYFKRIDFSGEKAYTAGRIYSSAVVLEKQSASALWEVGDYWPKEGTPKGVVYKVGENSFKVISLEESNALTWQSITGGLGTTYGSVNTQEAMDKAVEKGIENYPAFNFCYQLNGYDGWLLPSLGDYMNDIRGILDPFNAILAEKGERLLTPPYWSATEDTNDNADIFDPLHQYHFDSILKTKDYPVRCIREESVANE